MARTQRPLRGDEPAVRFAAKLRGARQDAGLTVRELARISGYATGTLSTAESGRRLPTWDVTAAFVQACRQPDLARWRGWWEAEHARETDSRPDPPLQPAASPETTQLPSPISAAPPSPTPATSLSLTSAARSPTAATPLSPAPATPPSPTPVASPSLTPPASVALSGPPGAALVPSLVVRTRWWLVGAAAVLSSVVAVTLTLALGLTQKPAAAHPAATAPNTQTSPVAAVSPCSTAGAVELASAQLPYDGQTVATLKIWHSTHCGSDWAELAVPRGWNSRVEIDSVAGVRCAPTDCTTQVRGHFTLQTAMLFGVESEAIAIGYVQLPTGKYSEISATAPE